MKKVYLIFPLVILLTLLVGMSAAGQQSDKKTRLLFVDETRSLELSMRVQGLASALKDRQELEIETLSIETENPTLNPVSEVPEEPYDLVIIVPPTIETGAIEQVWLVTKAFTKFPLEGREKAMAQLERLKQAISQAFEGEVMPVGVNDDIIPAYFSSLFLREGILR